MTEEKKKRADNYDEKLAIKGIFEDVIKVSGGLSSLAPTPVKPPKKK